MCIKEAFKLPEIRLCLMHVRREQILCVKKGLENNQIGARAGFMELAMIRDCIARKQVASACGNSSIENPKRCPVVSVSASRPAVLSYAIPVPRHDQ
jgi:hypothetical protein